MAMIINNAIHSTLLNEMLGDSISSAITTSNETEYNSINIENATVPSSSILAATTMNTTTNISLFSDEDVVTSTASAVLTSQQLTIGLWVPRIAGVITLVSSLCMIRMAATRWNHLFHRLVLGMSFYLCVMSIFMIYGPAAVPTGVDHLNEITFGKSYAGSQLSCNIQGFLLYFSQNTAFLYYGSFAMYSFVAVTNQFQKSKYLWIEVPIHIGVHIYPLLASILFLVDDAYNDTGHGFCGIREGYYPTLAATATVEGADCESSSNYVDDDDGMSPCTQGDVPNGKMTLFWIIPNTFQLLFPTILMTILYFIVKQQQRQLPKQQHSDKNKNKSNKSRGQNVVGISPHSLAIQAAVYLIPLYWAVLPYIVFEGLYHAFYGRGLEHDDPRWDKLFYLSIYTTINLSLFSFYVMFSYFYFSVEKKQKQKQKSKSPLSNAKTKAKASTRTDIVTNGHDDNDNDNDMDADVDVDSDTDISNHIDYIFSSEGEIEIEWEDDTDDSDPDDNEVQGPAIPTKVYEKEQQQEQEQPPPKPTSTSTSTSTSTPKPKYSFNIFDGTQDASGAFAAFVYAGDSEDERYDQLQTDRWKTVQDYV